jgi:pectate lyase-like protein
MTRLKITARRIRGALAPACILLLAGPILGAASGRAASLQAPALVGDGIHDDTVALSAMLARQRVVELPPGTFLVSHTLVLRAGAQVHGAGIGVTVLRLAPQSNQNLMQSEDFDALTGTGKLAEAPGDIRVSGLTLDGGFLSAKWIDPSRHVLNTRGSCLALYAKRVHLDIETNNCAEHMLYSEGQGPRNAEEVASNFRVQGLVAGEECVVFRGPGDSRFETLSAGICGAKLLQTSSAATKSMLYPADTGFDGIVVDRQSPYEGTLEIGFAHVFGSFSGWGLRTRGNPRFHAEHLVSESNLGGVLIDTETWGAIYILDIHSNGASHTRAAGIAREGLFLQSNHGFSISQGTIARTAGSAEGFVAARIAGIGSNVTLTLINTRDVDTKSDFRGTGVILTGSSNLVRLAASRTADEALVIFGNHNFVEVATDGIVRDVGQHNTVAGSPLVARGTTDPPDFPQNGGNP